MRFWYNIKNKVFVDLYRFLNTLTLLYTHRTYSIFITIIVLTVSRLLLLHPFLSKNIRDIIGIALIFENLRHIFLISLSRKHLHCVNAKSVYIIVNFFLPISYAKYIYYHLYAYMCTCVCILRELCWKKIQFNEIIINANLPVVCLLERSWFYEPNKYLNIYMWYSHVYPYIN